MLMDFGTYKKIMIINKTNISLQRFLSPSGEVWEAIFESHPAYID